MAEKITKIDLAYLEKKNVFPLFDHHISFYDEYTTPSGEKKEHIYLVSDEIYAFTTTTFVHSFFPGFYADTVIEKMMKSKNWPKSKYYGKSADEIKEEWEINRVGASTLGTEMHAKIEKFYNHPTLWAIKDYDILMSELRNYYTDYEVDNKELQQFIAFHLNGPNAWNWEPWKTEWRVYDESIKVAGSVDMLYKSPNYTEENKLLIMLDWKRSKEIKKENRWESAYPPIQDLPSANFYQYSLQLNIYKAIIEKNTPYKIEYMALGVFHPNQEFYHFHPIDHMPEHVNKIWKYRLDQLAKAEEEMKKKQNNLEKFITT